MLKKISFSLLLIAAVCILAACQNINTDKNVAVSEPVKEPAGAEYNNWLEYSNQSLGLSFNYPADAEVSLETKQGIGYENFNELKIVYSNKVNNDWPQGVIYIISRKVENNQAFPVDNGYHYDQSFTTEDEKVTETINFGGQDYLAKGINTIGYWTQDPGIYYHEFTIDNKYKVEFQSYDDGNNLFETRDLIYKSVRILK